MVVALVSPVSVVVFPRHGQQRSRQEEETQQCPEVQKGHNLISAMIMSMDRINTFLGCFVAEAVTHRLEN